MKLPSQSCIRETCMIRPNLLGLLGNTHIISPFAPKTSLLCLPHGECHPVGLQTHTQKPSRPQETSLYLPYGQAHLLGLGEGDRRATLTHIMKLPTGLP